MFQTITDTALLVTFVGIAAHWALYPTRLPRPAATCRLARGSVHALSLLLIEQKSSLLGALKKLVYLVTVLCFLVLALTGFWPLLVRGQHISGYLMMIHATFAPVFALCLAILAVTWAGSYSFAADDCAWVQRLLRRTTRLRVSAEEKPWRCSRLLQKVTFWLILFLALPLILSVIVSMFHLLGTGWQHTTLAIHRWTGLAFVIVAILFTYFAIRVRMTDEA
jgi:cytochrome b subunit of formate dehydrogenase